MKRGSPLASCSSACSLGERRVVEQRAAAAEADLRQPRAGAHQDRKRARADLQKERAGVALRHLVEGARLVGDDAREDVEPAGRAFRIGARRDVGGQSKALQQRHDVDAAGLQHRAVGESETRAARAASVSRSTEKSGPGRKLARTRVALAPSRRSRLAGWTCSSAGGSAMLIAPSRSGCSDRGVGKDARRRR